MHVPVVTNCYSTVRLHHMRDVSAEGRPVAPSGLSQQLAAWNGPQTGGIHQLELMNTLREL